MSTRASSRLRYALTSVATALVLYVAVVAGLTGVCHLLESRDEVFPYKNEDWLRYQLPAFFADDGRPRLMLAGPSTVRENLLVERFAQRFPQYRVFQGGLSQGTLVDSMVALEYAELAYGPQALPRVLILGLSPRFLAEIPAERPFSGGLDRYSRLYGTERRGAELKLVPKSSWSGLLAELRFHTRKQVPRFQAGLLAAMRPLFPYDLDRAILGLGLSKIGPIRKLAELVDLDLVLQYGPRWMLENAVSPYKYRGARLVDLGNLGRWLDNPDSFWREVYAWDPAVDAQEIEKRVARFRTFAAERDIELFVVNLPERDISRKRYNPEYYSRYEELLETSLRGLPWFDLRLELDDDEFHDSEHANVDGAEHLTRTVIGLLQVRGIGAESTP